MKQFSILATMAVISSLAVAAPVEKPRVIWVTDIVSIIKTVEVLTTVWVGEPASPTSASHHHDHHHAAHASAPADPTSASVAPQPKEHPDPAPSTSSAAAVAPAPAPAPTSAAVSAPAPAPAPATTSAPAPAPASSASAPAPAASVATESPAGSTYTGDITYYTPGLGSCGWTNTASQNIVALSTLYMNNPANPNSNPLCGKTITISYGGKQVQAEVTDTCEACSIDSIDLTPTLFQNFAALSVGRVSGVEWWFD